MIRNKKVLLELEEEQPAEMLALARTLMANERTFLSFVRTALGLAAAGGGMVTVLDHPLAVALGWIFIVSGALTFVVGLVRYWRRRGIVDGIVARREAQL